MIDGNHMLMIIAKHSNNSKIQYKVSKYSHSLFSRDIDNRIKDIEETIHTNHEKMNNAILIQYDLKNSIKIEEMIIEKLLNLYNHKYSIINKLKLPIEYNNYNDSSFINKNACCQTIKYDKSTHIFTYQDKYHKYNLVKRMLQKEFDTHRSIFYFHDLRKNDYFCHIFLNFNEYGVPLLPRGKKNKEIQWNLFINLFKKLY